MYCQLEGILCFLEFFAYPYLLGIYFLVPFLVCFGCAHSGLFQTVNFSSAGMYLSPQAASTDFRLYFFFLISRPSHVSPVSLPWYFYLLYFSLLDEVACKLCQMLTRTSAAGKLEGYHGLGDMRYICYWEGFKASLVLCQSLLSLVLGVENIRI